MKRTPLLLALSLLPSLEGIAAAPASLAGSRPNIIFVLTDDQGYGDISAHGNPILKTPHLDRLHAEGVRFTDFHVSPSCAPTRGALLTGRHEFKNGITHTVLERERLAPGATTVAQVLKSAGYTTGIFGKWHLGDEAEYQPDRRGFDEVFIHGGGGIGQTFPGSCGDAPGNTYFNPSILHNGRFEKTQGYCTDVFFGQAIRWIDQERQRNRPFFAYVATNAPHGPYIAKPEDKAVYAGKGLAEDVQNFFGMIHNIDQNVGALLARLDEWGIARNTLVVFMNDNGGTAGRAVFNAGMRAGKITAYLGGTRASSFWRWPGALKPADCRALTAHLDFFPTLAALAGADLLPPIKAQVEGRSLLPLLANPDAPWEDRHLFAHQGRWPKLDDPNAFKYRMASVRNTRWALVSENGGSEPQWQLFDLRSDYGQTTNVIERHPEVARELATAFDRWWAECQPLMVNEQAMGPEINPFQARYYAQFGGSPTAEDLKRMDPKGALTFGRPRAATGEKAPGKTSQPPSAASQLSVLPGFKWDRVPLNIHFGKADAMTDVELDFLARYTGFVTLEKRHGVQPHGSTEAGTLDTARRLKQRNPDIKVVFYLNAFINWPGYDAFRTYRDEWTLRDAAGKVVTGPGNTPRPDPSNPAFREWWSDAAAAVVRSPLIDGVFADALPQALGPTLARAVDPAKAREIVAGLREMLALTKRKIGPGKFVLANGLRAGAYHELLDWEGIDGLMIEHFGVLQSASPEDMRKDIDTLTLAERKGKFVVLKGWPGFLWLDKEMMAKPHEELVRRARGAIEFPLACFLIGARRGSYFCYSWGYRHDGGMFDSYPELERPCGPPRDDPVWQGLTARREFEHASVWVDLAARSAKIEWRAR
jgi:arylsulfatase